MSNMPSSPGEHVVRAASSGQIPLRAWEYAGAGDYAGFWRRFVAALLDFIIVGILLFICQIGLDAIGVDRLNDPIIYGPEIESSGWAVSFFNESVLSLAVGTLYFGYLESSSWQASFGKRALGIIVTNLDCERISPARAVGRHLATLVSTGIFFLGYLIQPFTKKRQALHDVIARTLVLKASPPGIGEGSQ